MNNRKPHFYCAYIFILLSFSALFAVPVDSLPPLFQGTILMHFPLAAFPSDSAGGSYFWIPVPEMGFSFHPIIKFPEGNGWWEFPIHILTFFPFLDKYAALGDVSIGAGFQAPPQYKFGLAYRFISGKFYPVRSSFYAHILEVDIAVPVKGFSGAGAKFDWLFSSDFEMTAPYVASTGKSYDHYEGTVFAIAPYWRFPLKYGQMCLAYRIVVNANLIGMNTQTQSSYKVNSRSISAFELNYTYP